MFSRSEETLVSSLALQNEDGTWCITKWFVVDYDAAWARNTSDAEFTVSGAHARDVRSLETVCVHPITVISLSAELHHLLSSNSLFEGFSVRVTLLRYLCSLHCVRSKS